MNMKDIYWMGVVASKEEIKSKLGRSDISINKQGSLQAYLKCISHLPNDNWKPGYTLLKSDKFQLDEFKGDQERGHKERIQHYRDSLQAYFIGFTCDKKARGYRVAEEIELCPIADPSLTEHVFIAVRAVEVSESVGCEAEDIKDENREEFPYKICYYSGSQAYQVIVSEWYLSKTEVMSQKEGHMTLELGEGWDSLLVRFPGHPKYMFVAEELHEKIMEKLSLKNENMVLKSAENQSRQKDAEWEFIEYFDWIARKSGLYYKKSDLINFHTAMKSGFLVILSGLSGTGKSRLVQAYADALGLEEDCFQMISVRPSWGDDSDLLGFVDTMHMIYRPGDTELIETLMEAGKEENKEKLYLICLDEMNLARVEHYFSQFLSVLELPEGIRKLRLYAQEYTSRLYNAERYPENVWIRDNIRFVGTVNTDESTFHFSDKVLDRANVISLEIVPYTEWSQEEFSMKDRQMQPWSYSEYKSMIKAGREQFLTEREKEFLWEVHLKFHAAGEHLGIGPRILKQISVYLENLPGGNHEDSLSREEGFDIQFVQRVLTKLRGQAQQLMPLFEECGEDSLYQLLEQYTDVSLFKRSREKLDKKARDLVNYGYTL